MIVCSFRFIEQDDDHENGGGRLKSRNVWRGFLISENLGFNWMSIIVEEALVSVSIGLRVWDLRCGLCPWYLFRLTDWLNPYLPISWFLSGLLWMINCGCGLSGCQSPFRPWLFYNITFLSPAFIWKGKELFWSWNGIRFEILLDSFSERNAPVNDNEMKWVMMIMFIALCLTVTVWSDRQVNLDPSHPCFHWTIRKNNKDWMEFRSANWIWRGVRSFQLGHGIRTMSFKS